MIKIVGKTPRLSLGGPLRLTRQSVYCSPTVPVPEG